MRKSVHLVGLSHIYHSFLVATSKFNTYYH